MKKFLIAAGLTLGLLFSAAPSHAQCVPLELVTIQLADNGWSVPVKLDDDATKDKIVAFYNQLPPPSDEKFEAAYLTFRGASFERLGGVLLVNDGAVCGHIGPLSADRWREFEDNVMGRQAGN
jgi:hypothetical protein